MNLFTVVRLVHATRHLLLHGDRVLAHLEGYLVRTACERCAARIRTRQENAWTTRGIGRA